MVKKGDVFLCTKTVIMEDGDRAYIANKAYISEHDGCLTDEQGEKKHHVIQCSTDKVNENTFLNTYFIKIPKNVAVQKQEEESKRLSEMIKNAPKPDLNSTSMMNNAKSMVNNAFTIQTDSKGHMTGIKDKVEKTDYSEINLEILDLMAERMTANKHKYPKGNSKKPIAEGELEWAIFRHIKKILNPVKGDVESKKDHLAAIACNVSMILDQEALRKTDAVMDSMKSFWDELNFYK